MWPEWYPQLSHLTPFSSPLRFLCWLSRFCCSSSGTSSLLSKWCTLNSRKTKTKRKSCELLPGALAALPLPAAGAGVGTDPAEPQLRDGWAWKDSPVPVFGEGHGLCRHRLGVNASMALQSTVLLFMSI